MLPYLREHFGNPSSGHAFGRRSQQAIAKARNQVASLLGCADDEVVFTSGGTEANNLAIRGVMEAAGQSGRVVTSVVEHPATEQPCAWLERRGTQVVRLGLPCGACDGVRGRHRDGGARRRGDGLRAAGPRPAHVGGRRRASRRGVDSFVEKRERAPVTITIGARSCPLARGSRARAGRAPRARPASRRRRRGRSS